MLGGKWVRVHHTEESKREESQTALKRSDSPFQNAALSQSQLNQLLTRAEPVFDAVEKKLDNHQFFGLLSK